MERITYSPRRPRQPRRALAAGAVVNCVRTNIKPAVFRLLRTTKLFAYVWPKLQEYWSTYTYYNPSSFIVDHKSRHSVLRDYNIRLWRLSEHRRGQERREICISRLRPSPPIQRPRPGLLLPHYLVLATRSVQVTVRFMCTIASFAMYAIRRQVTRARPSLLDLIRQLHCKWIRSRIPRAFSTRSPRTWLPACRSGRGCSV